MIKRIRYELKWAYFWLAVIFIVMGRYCLLMVSRFLDSDARCTITAVLLTIAAGTVFLALGVT